MAVDLGLSSVTNFYCPYSFAQKEVVDTLTDRIWFITPQGVSRFSDRSNGSTVERPRRSYEHSTNCDAMKDTAAAVDKPFIKKSASAGPGNSPEVFSEKISTFSRRELPAFRARKLHLAREELSGKGHELY